MRASGPEAALNASLEQQSEARYPFYHGTSAQAVSIPSHVLPSTDHALRSLQRPPLRSHDRCIEGNATTKALQVALKPLKAFFARFWVLHFVIAHVRVVLLCCSLLESVTSGHSQWAVLQMGTAASHQERQQEP